MAEEKKVKVKLHTRCLVDNVERNGGDVVEIEESIAEYFGVLVDAPKPPKAETKAAETK